MQKAEMSHVERNGVIMKRVRHILLHLFIMMGLLLGGCTGSEAAQDSWAVYVYMCGSDLETSSGFATGNLDAMKSVPLPENVRFVIQTGGAEKWHTKGIPGNALGRYTYDSNGFQEVERLQDASMGEVSTLEDFLRFAKENYPADHRMLVFWDHGGGSLGGVCFDEKYENNLSLGDMRKALQAVETADPGKPAFDLVLFDTCLMANIDTANTLYGFARYMVASEETMPGTGTDYAGWTRALAQNPSMDGKQLGIAICETYLPYCKKNNVDDMATLSLIDLGQMPALNAAYEKMGQEALRQSKANPRYFFTNYDRVAAGVENYGPNDRDNDNYTDMIDLGALADRLPELSAAPAFVQALESAVVYRTAGMYRQYGNGLSGYYCLDGKLDSLRTYTGLPGASNAFSRLYREMLAGSGDGTPWFYFDVGKLDNVLVEIDKNNVARVTLSPDEANAISSVDFMLCRYDAKGNLVFLGSDDKLKEDWEQGIFREDFDGMWPALNGHIISIYLEEQQPDYNMYHAYFLLNGKKCYMTAAYNFAEEKFEIVSVRRILKSGWLDRQVLQLKPGDKITPLFVNEQGKEVKGETFTLTGTPVLEDEPLPEDTYAFAFRFTTAHNETVGSETIHFVIQNGEMTPVK